MRLIRSIFPGIVACILTGCVGLSVDDMQYQSAERSDGTACVRSFGWASHFQKDCVLGKDDVTQFVRHTIEYRQTDSQDGHPRWGTHFDQRQAEVALDTIAAAQANNPVFVVVYVHGWHHNASSSDQNFQNFDLMLARVRDQLDRQGKSETKVVGIYAGWQGESRSDTWLNVFTIGSRAQAADIVATGQSSDTLDCSRSPSTLQNDLVRIANVLRANTNSRLLVVGHSLGRRILSTLFRCGSQKLQRPLSNQTTVVTVNAAVDAALYEPLYRPELQAAPQKPYWVNFTSRADIYTHQVLTAARLVNLMPSLAPSGADGRFSAIGHYQPYVTHTLDINWAQTEPCRIDEVNKRLNCDATASGGKRAGAWCLSKSTSMKNASAPCFIQSFPFSLPHADAFGHEFKLETMRKNADDPVYRFMSTAHDRSNWFRPNASETWLLTSRERSPGLLPPGFAVDTDSVRGQHIDAHVYVANLRTQRSTAPMLGKMWNISTTENVIDFAGQEGSSTGTGKHNGYVSTVIFKLVTELALADD